MAFNADIFSVYAWSSAKDIAVNKRKWLIAKVLSVESNLYYLADFLIERSLQRKAPM